MPQYNIHWKGYPHNHLPRIRVGSSHSGIIRSPSFVCPTAQQRCQLLSDPSVENAKHQGRSKFDIGRGGLHGFCKRRASRKLRPYFLMAGWHKSRTRNRIHGLLEKKNQPESASTDRKSKTPIRCLGAPGQNSAHISVKSATSNYKSNSKYLEYITKISVCLMKTH